MMHLKVMKSIINLWLGCGLLWLKDGPGLFPDFILETQKKMSWMHILCMFLTGLDWNWDTVLAWGYSAPTVNMGASLCGEPEITQPRRGDKWHGGQRQNPKCRVLGATEDFLGHLAHPPAKFFFCKATFLEQSVQVLMTTMLPAQRAFLSPITCLTDIINI